MSERLSDLLTHVPEPGEIALAGLWSFTLQAIAARAAHEINNALNGAVMNVAVVQARARPGADAGAITQFADAASSQLDDTTTLATALVALTRTPRGTTDVADILRHTATLLGAQVDGARSAPTSVDPIAARLAIGAALIAALTVETAGPVSANAPVRVLRGTTRADEAPTVVITPRSEARLPASIERALAQAAIVVTYGAGSLSLAFPAPVAHN